MGARSLTYQHADHVGQIVDDHWPGAIASPPAGPAAKDWKKWFTQHVVHIIAKIAHTHILGCAGSNFRAGTIRHFTNSAFERGDYSGAPTRLTFERGYYQAIGIQWLPSV